MSKNVQDCLLKYIFHGTDCTFIFPKTDDECVEIHANRHVIDKASDYMKAKFDTYKRNTLVIQDVKESVFKMVLEHVYTGVLPEPEILTQVMVFEMYDATQKYGFKGTTDSLIRHMIKHCNIDNTQELLLYLNFALKHYIIEVQTFIQNILERNTDIILFSEPFLNVHPRVINWIYSLNALNINEWDLVKIAEKYKAFHYAAGRHTIHSKIQPAINNIRFLSMAAENIMKTTLLSKNEKDCLIQVTDNKVSGNSVPMYLSRRRIGRCSKSIILICDDDRLKKLYDENQIKLGTFKGKMYFVADCGKVKAIVEDSGVVTSCEYQEFTPLKEAEEASSRPKKACLGIQQSVLYYKEDKKILINKKPGPVSKGEKEKNNEEEAATVSFGKLSLQKH